MRGKIGSHLWVINSSAFTWNSVVSPAPEHAIYSLIFPFAATVVANCLTSVRSLCFFPLILPSEILVYFMTFHAQVSIGGLRSLVHY